MLSRMRRARVLLSFDVRCVRVRRMCVRRYSHCMNAPHERYERVPLGWWYERVEDVVH